MIIPYWIKIIFAIYGVVLAFYSVVLFFANILCFIGIPLNKNKIERAFPRLIWLIFFWIIFFIVIMFLYRIPINKWIG